MSIELPSEEIGCRSPWPAVLSLIGLDYFSTLAYQSSVAVDAVGQLAPLATGVVVVITLCGVLPIYLYLAGRASDGGGAIGLLSRWVPGWSGKLLLLVLLGFAATDFVITRSLSMG